MARLGVPRGLRVVLVGLLALAPACGSEPGAARGIADRFDLSAATLTVGSKEFTEQLVLGEIAAQALQAAGATVDDRVGLRGSQNVRQQLLDGELDLYWEYTGTAWEVYLDRDDRFDTATEQYEAVATADLERNGVRWLSPAPFDNTYAIATTRVMAAQTAVATLSDLAALVRDDPGTVQLCAAEEFLARDDGLAGLQQHYDFELDRRHVHVLELHAIYPAVARQDPCSFAEVFSTNGRLSELDLVTLDDDQGFFPFYRPAVTVRTSTLEDHPALRPLFDFLVSGLDRDVIIDLNRQVDVEGRRPADVAADWLAAMAAR